MAQRKMKNSKGRDLLAFLLLVLCTLPVAAHGPADYAELYKEVSKSVVEVYSDDGGGTGVIISPDGYILTNAHVIYDYANDEVRKSFVALHDKRKAEAEIIGYDLYSDVALVKIDLDGQLPSAKIGNSDDLEIGNAVFAIGHPDGFEYSLSSGVVSFLNRLQADKSFECSTPFIQTDAAINPGNSGGPLLNEKGEVIGINTWGFTAGDDSGLNFAVPINLAVEVQNKLRSQGKVRWGMLGVYLDYEYENGLLVNKVSEGSGAEAAGIEPGDAIVEYNYMKAEDFNDFPCLMAGKEVPIRVIRDGQEVDLTVTLGAIEDGGRVAALN